MLRLALRRLGFGLLAVFLATLLVHVTLAMAQGLTPAGALRAGAAGTVGFWRAALGGGFGLVQPTPALPSPRRPTSDRWRPGAWLC